MESEARQNPLSKRKTIEQLRTTIDKLETIIEQLDSTSVVNLPSSNTIEALITTTEKLEEAISNLPSEAVAEDSPPTPISEVAEDPPAVTPIPLEEKPPVSELEAPKSQTSVPQSSLEKAPEQNKPIEQKTVTKPVTKVQQKSRKSKKKKNWIAIAIVALILAIIPISLKYLSPGTTQELLLEKVEEVVIEEAPVIARKLPHDKLQEQEKTPIFSEESKEQLEDIQISEIPQQGIENIAIIETPKQQEQETTIKEVATEDLIIEEVTEPEFEKYLVPEETNSKVTIKSDTEATLANNESERIVASDSLEVAEIDGLEITASNKSESNINKIKDEKLALEIDNIHKNIIEQEDLILVPENLITEVTEQPLELKTVIHDVKLTPDQNFIALLRDKIIQLSKNYQEDIVLSIEPNIANNILIVKIADDWYELESTVQDEIVADIFTRSQKLEFRKLEIKDQSDNLVARSPVVGKNMIIFRRDS